MFRGCNHVALSFTHLTKQFNLNIIKIYIKIFWAILNNLAFHVKMLLVLTEVSLALLAESFLSRWHPEKQSWVDKNRGKEDLCYSLVIVVKTEQSSPDRPIRAGVIRTNAPALGSDIKTIYCENIIPVFCHKLVMLYSLVSLFSISSLFQWKFN